MISYASVFTKGGAIIWSKTYTEFNLNAISYLIKNILIESRLNQNKIAYESYILQYVADNKFNLIFMIMISKIQIPYNIDYFLACFKKSFIPLIKNSFNKYNTFITVPSSLNEYDNTFTGLLKEILVNPIVNNSQKESPKKPRSFSSTKKGSKKLSNNKLKGKVMRKWADQKLTKSEQEALDCSRSGSSEYKINKIKNFDFNDKFSFSDNNSTDSRSGLISRLLKKISLNKTITSENISPAINLFKEDLINKNVSSSIAKSICDSVSASLVGKEVNTLYSLSHPVKLTLRRIIDSIIFPISNINLLDLIKVKKGTYKIVFIGTNGVGKSTSLSKIAYYLKSNGLQVSIAACDTFRSGAVEQLKVHSTALAINLHSSGYNKDASIVCEKAINEANKDNDDVILIDTAGRMQNNEPLMRSLRKLVYKNSPDLVLFVGEALVGNEGVDQLKKFSETLKEGDKEMIDGIFLTKMDAVSEKVGTVLSLTYSSGIPIWFIGTGQKYKDLDRLTVSRVVDVLLD